MSDRYEIQEKIGQGGIGAVYRAYDSQLKRSVAIKRMLPTEEDDVNGATPAEMILKEATTLSALQHPNIITVYDIGLDEEGAFVVMELLKGETLDQVVQRGVLTLKDFCEVVSQTLEALIAAEAAGVLHRDLKPTNVMVNWLPSKKFQVKILDFSLAKFSRTPAPQTIDQGDAIFGSIYFMAPEQFERGNLDKRTDLYSMGCLYYYCLTGQYPFQGESAAQVMASHLQGTVVPLEQIRADLPAVICQWVMWLINRYAKDRPQDSKEAFENFQQLAEAIDPNTNRVPLSGLQTASALNSTSRRLIVPPPRKTTAVTEVAPGAEYETGDDTGLVDSSTGAITAMPRPENKLMYLWVLLGIVGLTLVGLGFAALVKKGASDEATIRFEALAGSDPIEGTPKDIPLIVGFLESSSPQAVTTAKHLLFNLKEENGAYAAINDAIVAALGNAKTPASQEALVEVIDYRSIPKAEELLISMTRSDRHPDVATKAFQALGTGGLGGNGAFRSLLENFQGHFGSDLALQAIAQRLVDKDAAAKLVADTMKSHRKKPRWALIRVLGTLGTPFAFDSLREHLDDEGGTREDRLAALRAFRDWPRRSTEVTTLLEETIILNPREVPITLETYAFQLGKPGSEPTDAQMIKLLNQHLLNEDPDLHSARGAFIYGLTLLEDQDFAVATAEKLLASKLLSEASKDDVTNAFPALNLRNQDVEATEEDGSSRP